MHHNCTGDDCDFMLTPPEVAERLRVPTSWVYQHQAELPMFRLGRYVRCLCGELSRFVREQRTCK